MLDIREEKFVSLNSLIKQKLRQGFFDSNFLASVFSEFPAIIEEYSSRFYELCELYFRDKNFEINSFAISCFKLYFDVPKSNKKFILLKLISFVCEKSGSENLPFAIYSDYKTNSLLIMKEICQNEDSLFLVDNLYKLLVSMIFFMFLYKFPH